MPRLTKIEQKTLELLCVDVITYGLDKPEQALRYIALRAPELGPKVDDVMLRRYKQRVRSSEYHQAWLSNFTKEGYVMMFKDLIDEISLVQRQAFTMLLQELNYPLTKEERDQWIKKNPDKIPPPLQNRGLVVALMAQITGANKRKSQLMNSGPVAAMVHAIARVMDPSTPPEERQRLIEQLKRRMNAGQIVK